MDDAEQMAHLDHMLSKWSELYEMGVDREQKIFQRLFPLCHITFYTVQNATEFLKM